MNSTPYNARYTKLNWYRNIWHFYVFYDFFAKRWIRRLTTIGNSCIIAYFRRHRKVVIKKTRHDFTPLFNTEMHKTCRCNHPIFILSYKKVMHKIGSYRRNENIVSMNLSLCSRWKCSIKMLYAIEPTFAYSSSIYIVNKRAPVN